MKKERSFVKNYIYNTVYQVISLLVPLITTPYISQALGAEGIGRYSFTYSNVTYFVLFAALGTTVYARRESAIYQNDKKNISKVFWEILILRALFSQISFFAYLLYAFMFDNSVVVYVQSIYIISVFFDITWFFQGLEDFGTVVFRSIIFKIISVAFVFIFVKSPDNLLLYVLGLAIITFLGNMVMWIPVRKYILWIPIKELNPKKHLKGSWELFVPTIAAQVYLLLDKTMIGVFTSTSLENGYYEQAQKLITMSSTLVTSISVVMMPKVAFDYANRQREKLRVNIQRSFQLIWFLGSPIMFGIISISANLVPWFFGAGFEPVTPLLYLFSLIIIPIGISSITGSQYLVATKKQNAYTLSIIVGAIANLSLNLLLIPRLFSIGASIASVICEYVIAVVQVYYIAFRLKEIKLGDIFYKSWKYLLSGTIMCTLLLIISHNLEASLKNTMIVIVIGIIIYLLMLSILKDSIIMEIRINIKRKIASALRKKEDC